jgi:DNA-binding PadR family transcriptional regulator
MGAGADKHGSDNNAVAMRSAGNWAVLGLVIQRPGYGYELFKRGERTYGKAIVFSHQAAVYNALTALEKHGLIEEVPPDDNSSQEPRRQPKPRYRATPTAVPAYQDWLVFQATQEGHRSEQLAVQVASLEPPDGLVVLKRYEQHLFAERKMLAEPAAVAEGSPLARRLVHEARRLEAEPALKWAQYARRQLEAIVAAEGHR